MGKYLSKKVGKISPDDTLKLIFKVLFNLFKFFETLKNPLKVKIENIKERKEFYCLLYVYDIIKTNKKNENNFDEKFSIQIIEDLKNKQELYFYFIKDKNENNEDVYCAFNYYYTSDQEKQKLGDFGDEEEKTYNVKFKVEYGKKFWDIIIE